MLIEENYQLIQNSSMQELLELIKDDDLWFDNHEFKFDMKLALKAAYEAGQTQFEDFDEWFKQFKIESQKLPYLSLKGKL